MSAATVPVPVLQVREYADLGAGLLLVLTCGRYSVRHRIAREYLDAAGADVVMHALDRMQRELGYGMVRDLT